MSIDDLLKMVDKEILYQHILNIEGLRHPIDDPEFLDETANYIFSEFESYGLTAKEHRFQVKGFNHTFRNIEGFLQGGNKKEVLITSHYDTASLSPGANDNGSGVAGMLEIARVLADSNNYDNNIRFISFTLEEIHPVRELRFRNIMLESGLFDEEARLSTYHAFKLFSKVDFLQEKAIAEGKTIKESWQLAFDEVKSDLTVLEKDYLKKIMKHYSKTTRINWIGDSICVGSTKWVKEHLKMKDKIIGVLNLEEIGYTSKKKFSQDYPPGLVPNNHSSYNTDIPNRIGDFIGIFSDKNSSKLAEIFCENCKNTLITLPYHNLCVDMSFNDISSKAIDLLRSDHAPFWRENIPAITITDTFEFRYPFYHTSADVIDNLDFYFIKKICQTTIATIIRLLSYDGK